MKRLLPPHRPVSDLSHDEIHAIRMARGVTSTRVTGLEFGYSTGTIRSIQVGILRKDVPFTAEEKAKATVWLVGPGGRGVRGRPGVPRKLPIK